MISVIKSENEFENIRENWNVLYSGTERATVFQTFDYNFISWNSICRKDKNNKLYILAYYKTEGCKESNAIFPFYIDKNKRLRFINDSHTDYCDAIIPNSAINRYDIIYELYKFIDQDKNIKSVFLDNVTHYSYLATHLKIFKTNSFLFSQTEHLFINYTESENPIQSLAHLNSSNKYNLKHIYKECKDLDFKIYSKASGDEYPKKDLEYLANQMVSKGFRSKDYFNAEMLSLWEKLYNGSLIEVAVLYNAEKMPISIQTVFLNPRKQEFIIWIILYENPKYNQMNNIRYFVEKAQNGNGTIDFGRGGYAYKMIHLKPDMENIYRLMYSKTLWGNWYIFFKINISHLRKTLASLRK